MRKFRKLFWIGFGKTVLINFRFLPFNQAIKFPIILTRNTTFGEISGRLEIQGKCKTGMIRFGFLHSDLISWKDQRTFIGIKGKLILKDQTQFGVGCKIVVDRNATLELGKNTAIGSNTRIVCREKIFIGDNFRAAWDVQIMDTNFHYLKDKSNGLVKRKTKPIIIGKNNWIGNRSSLMQGTITPNFFSVASGSLCNKSYMDSTPEFSLVAGNPAKLLKNNVYRVLDKEEKQINEIFEKNPLDDFVSFDSEIQID